MTRGHDIAARLSDLAVGTVQLARRPFGKHLQHLPTQLVRSVTGAGANYAEAQGAESRADFIHKLRIVEKELRESAYWLSVVRATEELAADAHRLAQDCDELLAIICRSIATARSNAEPQAPPTSAAAGASPPAGQPRIAPAPELPPTFDH